MKTIKFVKVKSQNSFSLSQYTWARMGKDKNEEQLQVSHSALKLESRGLNKNRFLNFRAPES